MNISISVDRGSNNTEAMMQIYKLSTKLVDKRILISSLLTASETCQLLASLKLIIQTTVQLLIGSRQLNQLKIKLL